MKILYQTLWYPSRVDAMSGLFVRKHAVAAQRAGDDVCVLLVQADEAARGLEVQEQTAAGVREIYVYYSGTSTATMLKALWRGWQEVKTRWGMPDLVQQNVLSKSALLTYYLHKRYALPYVIVEHWSGYLPENGDYRDDWHGRLMRKIASEARAIFPVSEALEHAMKARGIQCHAWGRVHNVVDDFFYEAHAPSHPSSAPFVWLHVSCFDERSKNVQGLLRAVAMLASQRTDFVVRMVGVGPDWEAAKALSKALGLSTQQVTFEGEKTPAEVHLAMQESDCFVLFSRYETASVVLAESMASGLPIVGTRAGAIPETMGADSGVLVASEDEHGLAKAMSWMMDHAQEFDRENLRRRAAKYSEREVGRCLHEIYRKYGPKGPEER